MEKKLTLHFNCSHEGCDCLEIRDGDDCLYRVPSYPIKSFKMPIDPADGTQYLKISIEATDGMKDFHCLILNNDISGAISRGTKTALRNIDLDKIRRMELRNVHEFVRAYDTYDKAVNDLGRNIALGWLEKYKINRTEENPMKSDDKIYHLIEQADRCRKDIVLCLLGKPGIGKTEAIERFARDHGRNVVHIIASQILPNEVSGMTMPNQETHSMDVFDHYRLSHMKDGDILFFDELLKGQQHVLNACLTLIQERRLMSGTKLPDVLIIAAANPLATPMQLPPEIRQRFMFVEVEWDQNAWIKYMKQEDFGDERNLDNLAKEVQKEVDGKFSDWNTLTPRTATKLCRWMRACGCNQNVREYIVDIFGYNIASLIESCANVVCAKSSKQQIAERVIECVTSATDEDDIGAGVRRKALELAQKISDETDDRDDMAHLLASLKKLPEWNDIQEALKNSEID